MCTTQVNLLRTTQRETVSLASWRSPAIHS